MLYLFRLVSNFLQQWLFNWILLRSSLSIKLHKQQLTFVNAHGWSESFFLKAPLFSVPDKVCLGGGRKKSKEKRSSVYGGFSSILCLLASSSTLCVVAIILSADSAVCSANSAYKDITSNDPYVMAHKNFISQYETKFHIMIIILQVYSTVHCIICTSHVIVNTSCVAFNLIHCSNFRS